jgi:hypothetical protein
MIRIRKTATLILFSLIVAALTCITCEGLSSILFVAREAATGRPIAERVHTEYDEELGWINIPNIYVEDMYGHGIYVKTNSQSFRSNKDFGVSVPSNKIRVICSGDSFTFGYGVDNEHTWCQLLASVNERLEPVNMGQGGYGVDQAYLWYKRDGTKLEHDLHIFAFITDDFERMQSSSFLGYGKPVLAVQDGNLVASNVPVPRRSFYVPWLNHGLRTLNGLDSVRLSQELAYQENPAVRANDQSHEVVKAILADLHRLNQSKNSILVLVYLPIRQDYMEDSSEPWRQFLRVEAAENDLIYIDLVDEFRQLSPQDVSNLFIAEGVIERYGAAGHYSENGNAYIANTLYKSLLVVPEVGSKLQQ